MSLNKKDESQLRGNSTSMALLKVIEELRNFDTAMIANSIECLTQEPPENWYMSCDIKSVTPTFGPTVGIAVTCEMDTSSPDDGAGDMDGYWEQLEKIHLADVPVVWVVKAVGSRDRHECILGDGMAKMLYAAGCIGVVTDGGVRDVAGLISTSFAAYCCGTTIHHCRIRVRKIDEPVSVGGITIYPGDLIHANQEGVLRIPKDCLPKILESASRTNTFESKAHCMLRRTDLSPTQKRQGLESLLSTFGIHDCVSNRQPGNLTSSDKIE